MNWKRPKERKSTLPQEQGAVEKCFPIFTVCLTGADQSVANRGFHRRQFTAGVRRTYQMIWRPDRLRRIKVC